MSYRETMDSGNRAVAADSYVLGFAPLRKGSLEVDLP